MKSTVKKVVSVIAAFCILVSIFQAGCFSAFFNAFAQESQTEATKKHTWNFESIDELKDFQSSFWSSTRAYTQDAAVTDRFSLSNGKLKVRDDSPAWDGGWPWGTDSIASLTLSDPYMDNFDFEVKYKHGDGDFGMVFLSFREKTAGQPFVPNATWTPAYGKQADGTPVLVIGEHYGAGGLFLVKKNQLTDWGTQYGLESYTRLCENRWQDNDSSHADAFSKYYTLRVRMVGNYVETWLDGVKLADQILDEDAPTSGYISLNFANTRGYVDYVSVTRLDDEGNEIDLNTEINAAQSQLNAAYVPTGLSLSDIQPYLPDSAVIAYGGKQRHISIGDWKCDNYDPNKAGVYTFKANFANKVSFASTNTVCITVTTSPDTVALSLGNENEIRNRFESYHTEDAQKAQTVKSDFSEYWEIVDGSLKRKNIGKPDQGELKDIAVLTLKDRTYDEFILNVDYKQSTESWKRPQVGFGAQSSGDYAWSAFGKGGAIAFAGQDAEIHLVAPKLTSSDFCTSNGYVPDYKPYEWHHMTIAVGNGKARVVIDGCAGADIDLTNYKPGYIYLACGLNYASFKNLTITPNVTGIRSVNTANAQVKLGTELSQVSLPKKVTAVKKDGTKIECPVVWHSETYNPNRVGKYVFKGTLVTDSALNPLGMSCDARVEVTEEYDPKTTVRYYFDLAEEMKDFEAYFAENTKKGLQKVNWSDYWSMSDGVLARKDMGGFNEVNPDKKVSTLVLANKNYRNFELNVDYKHGTASWKWPAIAFGINNKTGFTPYDMKGGYIAYLEQEGHMRMWLPGNEYPYMTQWDNYSKDQELKDEENYDKEVMHHLRLVVMGNTAMMFVDDAKEPRVFTLPDAYNGGYIGIVGLPNTNRYSNLVITDYDAKALQIKSIQSFEEKVIDHTAKTTDTSLPAFAKVVCNDNKEYYCKLNWDNNNFRSNVPGNYNLTGDIILNAKSMTNPKKISAVLKVKVIADYDSKTTIKYYFEDPNELKDFTAYYADQALDGMNVIDWKDKWVLRDGRICRISDGFTNDAEGNFEYAMCEKMSSLVWKLKKLQNYEVTVNYKQGTDTWRWSMLGTSIIDPSQCSIKRETGNNSSGNAQGGVYWYSEREGSLNAWGAVENGASPVRLSSALTLPKDEFYDMNEVNTLRVKVVNGVGQLYVNNSTVPLNAQLSSKEAGFIAMVCGANSSEFDNLTITALNKNGNPTNIGLDFGNGGASNSGSKSPKTTSVETGNVVFWLCISAAFVATIGTVLLFSYKKYIRIKKSNH